MYGVPELLGEGAEFERAKKPRRPYRHWAPEEDAKIAELAAAGMSAAEIGKALGRGRNAIIGRAYRGKIKLCPPSYYHVSDEEKRLLREWRESGVTYREISKRLGISYQAAHQRAVTAGLAQPKGRVPGFSSMAVGEVRESWHSHRGSASSGASIYGKKSGKSFGTRVVNGKLYIVRYA